jgi:hypothetical protein
MITLQDLRSEPSRNYGRLAVVAVDFDNDSGTGRLLLQSVLKQEVLLVFRP